MRKLICLILVLVVIPMMAWAEDAPHQLYPRFGNVIDIEYDTDCVTVDDGLGNLWEFFGCDYFFFDDLVIMIMSDSGTPDWIYDDVVINAYPCDVEDATEIIELYRTKLAQRGWL